LAPAAARGWRLLSGRFQMLMKILTIYTPVIYKFLADNVLILLCVTLIVKKIGQITEQRERHHLQNLNVIGASQEEEWNLSKYFSSLTSSCF
jgi:hypothetical protein